MPKGLRLYVTGLVVASAIALVITSLVYVQRPGYILGMNPAISVTSPATEIGVLVGLGFWTLLTLVASAAPVRMPRGAIVSVAMAPVIAAAILGGPVAAGWVAAIGTTELRELKGRIPWYGSLFNHAGIVLPSILGALVYQGLNGIYDDRVVSFLAALVGGAVVIFTNLLINAGGVSLLRQLSFRLVLAGDTKEFLGNQFALAPLAWLMAQIYLLPNGAGIWATLIFGIPLYTTRAAFEQYVEMREMFTQTIGALSGAVDARDPFTGNHSRRVMEISSDIGQVMRLGEAEMEALEWGGLLHDVGKIGVPDHVLLKADKLTKDERTIMNSHPVLGAQIIAPVTKLAPELPIIRHHHEWFNGSGYPDRLIGEEIPKLARVLHVADAFEAMTAARPYRMVPLTAEMALGELRKFAGIQFDPQVVDAFVKTKWVEGIHDPGRHSGPDGRSCSDGGSDGPTKLRALPPLIGDNRAASTAPGASVVDSR